MADLTPLQDLAPDDDLVLLTCSEMAAADAATMAAGTPGMELMEAAGAAVAGGVIERYRRQPVVVLCGPGNNGGDGFVAARRLQASGWSVRLGLMGTLEELKGDAAKAAGLWKRPVEAMTPHLLDGHPIVVDALFGAGLSRPIEGAAGEVIDRLTSSAMSVVSVDVPSGLHGDTGEVFGRAVRADMTVTFFRAKPGHFSLHGRRLCGELAVADIGIPAPVLYDIRPLLWRNEPVLWSSLLRRDELHDHKYKRGHLTILGGATATGAARLAALAARRCGAGLVTIAAPSRAMHVYQAAEPGNLIAEADASDALGKLLTDERRNAILIGPGSGQDERTRQSVLEALATRRTVLLDADALTVFAGKPDELFSAIRGPVLMTPHAGEFRRLFPDLADRPGKVGQAREAARRSGATVLLKGPDTVVAAPDGRSVINVHAPGSLATAGSGDVLAGIAGGLLAQNLSPLAAGAAAAWLHGECAHRFGKRGMIAEDLIAQLPDALGAAMN